MADRIPHVQADFNRLFASGSILCLSHGDSARDERGQAIELHEGMKVIAVEKTSIRMGTAMT